MQIAARFKALTLVVAACAGLFGAVQAQAQGDLLVAPTRVVINNSGSAEVVLSNIGTQPATYRISAELRRMGENGDFTEVAEADANPVEKAAMGMISFAPRRVTLLPGQPQSVRISIRPPEGLPDGEYRVHLNFRAVPPAVKADETADASATGVTIKLVPVYGITIPVFLRRGRLEVSATLSNPALVRSEQATFVELDVNRTGQRSVFGEMLIKGPDGGVIYYLRGIAVYPEITHRKVRMAIPADVLPKLTGRRITIEYRELPENGGALIAQTTATLQ